jgi:hypothetical protein
MRPTVLHAGECIFRRCRLPKEREHRPVLRRRGTYVAIKSFGGALKVWAARSPDAHSDA